MTDPVLEALWKRVLDDWESDAAHGAFLQHCQSTEQLLEAAVRYRGMSGDRDRGPSAEKRLQAVAFLAMAELETARSHRPAKQGNAGRWALIVFFVGASLAILYATAL